MRNSNYLIPIALFLFFGSSLFAQNADCDIFEVLPPIVDFQLSTDNPPVPCGFVDASTGIYVNQCSPCGNKIADDDCINTPISSLCSIDGFTSSTAGFTNDVFVPTLGFCGGGTGTHNNLWIGFAAQTNVIELLLTSSNCNTNTNERGIQIAIAETDCEQNFSTVSGMNTCFGAVGQGGLFNNSTVVSANNLVPGNTYYILIDGFAGGECDFQLDVIDGFGIPEFDVVTSNGILCPDVLNPGHFTSQFGSGVIVDVTVGGIATTDLTFYWLNPSDEVIATTTGEILGANVVRGELEASFFNEQGTYSVQIIDNGSCCPLCTEVELTLADPPSAAAAALFGANGETELNCSNDVLQIMGMPEDGSTPAIEQWQIVNAAGERVQLDIHLVAQEGRLDEITISRAEIESFLPGQDFGTVTIVYGFLSNFTDLCFSDAAVTVPFDFRETDNVMITGGSLSCQESEVVLIGSTISTGNLQFCWTDENLNPLPNGPSLSVTSPGTYFLTVKNLDSGCETTESIEVSSTGDTPNVIPTLISGDLGPINCSNLELIYEGELITPNPNVTFVWTDPNGVIIPGVELVLNESSIPGTYSLTATDVTNSCFSISTITPLFDFAAPEDLVIQGESVLSCQANTVQLFGSTSTMNASFEWTLNGDPMVISTDQNPVFGMPGVYSLTVTGPNGCFATVEFEVVNDDALPVASASASGDITCVNEVVTLSGSSSVANSDFRWSGPPGFETQNTQDVYTTIPGEYIFTVTNIDNLCESSFSILVNQDIDVPDLFVVGVVLECDPTAENRLSATSTVPSVSYLWEGPNGFISIEANPVITDAGIYSVVVTNPANGCTISAEAIVDAADELEFEPNLQSVTCFGGDDGFIEIVILSGVAPFTVSGDLSSLSSNNLASGLYTAIIQDASGCEAAVNFSLTEPDELVLTLNPPGSNGALEVLATGGTPGYTYLWNDGTVGPIIEEPVDGFAYELTVTDANGCEESLNSIITSIADLAIDSNDVSLFPNPNRGDFQFSFESVLELEKITIYNIYGQVVYQMENELTRSSLGFSLFNLSQGTYLFEARFEQGIHRQKMIIL